MCPFTDSSVVQLFLCSLQWEMTVLKKRMCTLFFPPILLGTKILVTNTTYPILKPERIYWSSLCPIIPIVKKKRKPCWWHELFQITQGKRDRTGTRTQLYLLLVSRSFLHLCGICGISVSNPGTHSVSLVSLVQGTLMAAPSTPSPCTWGLEHHKAHGMSARG